MSNHNTESPLAHALAAYGTIQGERLVLFDGIGREVASMEIRDVLATATD